MALTERLQILINADAKGAQREMQKFGRTAERSLGKTDDKLRILSGQLTSFGVGAVFAGGLVAAGMVKIGSTFEDVNRKIIIGTGASGAALKGLNADARAVAGDTASTISEVGTAIADLNTRLGLSGAPLQALTDQFLDLSRLTGSDIGSNIADITRVFGDWSISTDGQSLALDKLFVAAQTTGIGIDQLQQQVVQFGAPLRGLGFEFDEAVALFSKFEKEGVNTTTVLAGLRRGLSGFAKAGEEPAEAFERLVVQIKNARTEGEATALGFEAFGDRAGVDLALAIREGRFEIEELVAVLGDADGTIKDTAENAETFGEKMAKAFNQLQLAVEPIAAPTFDGIGKAAQGVQGLTAELGKLPPVVTNVAGGLVGVATGAALGVGALALVVGQSIKVALAFKAVTAQSVLLRGALAGPVPFLVGLGIVSGTVGVLNDVTGRTKDLTDATTGLQNALKGAEPSLRDFQRLAQTPDPFGAGLDPRNWRNAFDDLIAAGIEFADGTTTSLRKVREAIDAVGEGGLGPLNELGDQLERERQRVEVGSESWEDYGRILDEIAKKRRELLGTDFGKNIGAAIASAGDDGVVRGQTDATKANTDALDDNEDASGRAKDAADKLKSALGRLSAQQKLNTLAFDVGAARASSFADALERSTSTDNILESAIGAGKALNTLRKGMGLIPPEADKIERSTGGAVEKIDLLQDAANQADPALSRLGIALGASRAAASAFSQSLEDAGGFGRRLGSALGVGDAFSDFRKTFRRLPKDIDIASVSMGKLRPRTADAVRNVLSLGAATGDYLQQLIATGASSNEVRAEASRLNAAYREQLGSLGLTSAQLEEYIKLTNTAPESVETAIRLSGEEAARFKLNAYIGLLTGKIPPEVATDVVASINSGQLDEAAAKLERFAATNPANIDVTPVGTPELERAQATLFDLPKRYDPIIAATGDYTDAQYEALDAVLQLGGAAREYLTQLVGSGQTTLAVTEAERLREKYAEVFGQVGITGEALEDYYVLLGIAEDQVVTSIEIANFDATVFQITTVIGLLEGIGELDPEVALELADALLLEDYAGVKEILEQEIEATLTANTDPAELGFAAWSSGVLGTQTDAPVGIDPKPAQRSLWELIAGIESLQPKVSVSVGLTPQGEALLRSVGGTAAFGAGGFGSNASGSTFGYFGGVEGERATGGPLWSGRWLVGEKGPEIMELGTGVSGRVTPNQGSMRALSPSAAPDPREVVRELKALRAELSDAMDGGNVSVGAINNYTTTPAESARETIRALRTQAWLGG